MFSLVNSSCSSSKDSERTADARGPDHLPPQEANQAVRFEARTKNFSIRDHVLASRSKNIGASWPFSRQLLQICLKNGIRDLLPPFDPTSSLRPAHLLVNPVPEAEKGATSSPQLGQTVLLDEPGEPAQKKCSRIIQKEEVISETSREGGEEIISSTPMASDSMASKVCPVCKAFSSTSNTALNAHMDQCLSTDSDATLAAKKVHMIKAIKPRKKRLLVDIYETTPVSTLEDLDRRNGTSWATDLYSPALTVETSSEAKKPRLAESVPRDDKSEQEVYVDSNGIKIRMLSKITDTPNESSARELRPDKNIEAVSDGKVMSIIMKDHLGTSSSSSSSSKKMKLKSRSKKLRSLKLLENEVHAEASHHEESHMEEEGSPVHFSDEIGRSLSCGSATLKNWPSSKRSDLTKKSAKKAFHKAFQHLKSSDTTPSSSQSHLEEKSRLLQSKTVNFPSNAVQNMENEEKDSQERPLEDCTTNNALLLKLSRASRSLVSSPGSTGEEFSTVGKQKSRTSPKPRQRLAKSCLLLKTKKLSNLSSSNSGAIKMGNHGSLMAWNDKDRCISKVQVDHNSELGTLSRAFEENAGATCTVGKPLNGEDWDRVVNTNDKMTVTMPIGPLGQMDKPAPDQLLNRGFESQAKAASLQESSACLTRNEAEPVNPRKNSSIAFEHLCPNQDNSLGRSREPSVSPSSSTSTISPAFPKECRSEASGIKPVLNPSTTRENLSFPSPFAVPKEGNPAIDIGRNQQVEKPCCCSRQSIMAGNMKQKPHTNLYIRPSISCFFANSNSQTDASIAPSMESPTESILTKAFSDVGSASPSCGTPTQSSSSSILRLMGKDLMVVNNEESARIPKIHSPTVQGLASPFGFGSSHACAPNYDTFSFDVCNQHPTANGLKERNLLPGFNQDMNQNGYMAKDVVVIDDSDEVFAPKDTRASSHTMFQSTFGYFPPHSRLLPIDNGIQPLNPINQGSSFPASHWPSPFVIQSSPATHLNLPLHYPQSFR